MKAVECRNYNTTTRPHQYQRLQLTYIWQTMVIHVVFFVHEVSEFCKQERDYDENDKAYEAFIALFFPFLKLIIWELARLHYNSIMCFYPKILLAEVGEI